MFRKDKNKKEVYNINSVVNTYNSRLYLGRSRGLFFSEEISQIINWFDDGMRVLDCPCGTGKLALGLKEKKKVELYGGDISELMLKKASELGLYKKLSIEDLSKTSYPDNFFDVVYTSRFFMLFKEIDIFLVEIRRILKSDGILVFDSIRRSTHNLLHITLGTDEGYNFPRSTKQVLGILQRNNFKVLSRRSHFLLSSGIMNRLPKGLLSILISLEKWFPEEFRVMEFYKVKKFS
ncbi:MAG TPA: class I SAM-dependent methyltransferase [Candidatus Scalindua sp.]|nr:class I SAM-dependent methyltransferase [Candidatus Scalindua sp.]